MNSYISTVVDLLKRIRLKGRLNVMLTVLNTECETSG